jgi:hypothetical protein
MTWSHVGRYGLTSSTYPAEAPWYIRGNQLMRHICESGQPWSTVADSGWLELYPAGVPMQTLACMSSSVDVIAETHHHLCSGNLMQPVLIGQSHQISQDPDVCVPADCGVARLLTQPANAGPRNKACQATLRHQLPPRILTQSSFFFLELSWQ